MLPLPLGRPTTIVACPEVMVTGNYEPISTKFVSYVGNDNWAIYKMYKYITPS